LLAWGAATPAADPERWKRLMAAFDREPSDPMVAGALLKVALADPTDEATFLKTLPTVVGDEKRRSAELVLGAYSALRTTAGEATTHFQRATALDPKAPEHFERILTAAQLRPDASLDVIEAGRKVWPDQPGLQTLRGLLLFNAGKLHEAMLALEAANLAKGGADPEICSRLADVCRKLGIVEKEASYRRLAESPRGDNKPAADVVKLPTPGEILAPATLGSEKAPK
jgi:Flp pilus assembly protein TadD